MENRWTIMEFFLDAYKQYVKRNTIVVSEIPQSDQASDLKPIVTSFLSDVNINVASREREDNYIICKS